MYKLLYFIKESQSILEQNYDCIGQVLSVSQVNSLLYTFSSFVLL